MTSELLPYAPPATDLMRFAEDASAVHGIAKALATTSFVPASMKNKPDEITAAILFGRELNLDPMTSLQTINVIQGRPTLTANAMRGLAMGAGVRFRLEESTETRCVYSAQPPGGEWTTVTWTIDQARKLGLTTKENWKNQPGVMLIARATSQLCRLVAANILIGAAYSAEEMTDTDLNPAPEAPEKPKNTRRKIEPAPAAEPELVPDDLVPEYATGVAAVPAPNPTPAYEQPKQQEIGYDARDTEKRTGPEEPVERADSVSAETRKALMASFNDAGIRARNERLSYVSDVLGREVHSVNQITEAEGQKVIESVKQGWPQTAPVPAG